MPQQFSFLEVSAIIDAAKAEAIGSTTSSLTALQDTQLIERVEQINTDFVNSAHTRHHKGGWSWMEEVTNFQTVAQTTLNGAVVAAAATFILTDASEWDTEDMTVIQTAKNAIDFVENESKSSNTLTVSTTTGANVISMDHASGERCEKLYSLPSDYAKTRKLFVNSIEYFYHRADLFPIALTFDTRGDYLFMPRGIGDQDVTHYYEKRPATLTATTDTTDIPTSFQRYPIEMLKAHIYGVRRKRQDIGTSLQLAAVAMEEALDYDVQRITQGSTSGIDVDY